MKTDIEFETQNATTTARPRHLRRALYLVLTICTILIAIVIASHPRVSQAIENGMERLFGPFSDSRDMAELPPQDTPKYVPSTTSDGSFLDILKTRILASDEFSAINREAPDIAASTPDADQVQSFEAPAKSGTRPQATQMPISRIPVRRGAGS